MQIYTFLLFFYFFNNKTYQVEYFFTNCAIALVVCFLIGKIKKGFFTDI